jgi:hypothetical protein
VRTCYSGCFLAIEMAVSSLAATRGAIYDAPNVLGFSIGVSMGETSIIETCLPLAGEARQCCSPCAANPLLLEGKVRPRRSRTLQEVKVLDLLQHQHSST